jgi:hypothetical protein
MGIWIFCLIINILTAEIGTLTSILSLREGEEEFCDILVKLLNFDL